MKPHPPKRPLHFLRWFCREDYLEEIEGDSTDWSLRSFHYLQLPINQHWLGW
jgi:hypothetical protein